MKKFAEVLQDIAKGFPDRHSFIEACSDAWAETHNVRPGPKGKKELCFLAIARAVEKWRETKPQPNLTNYWIGSEIKRANNEIKRLADSTIQKYVKLYRIKQRPAASITKSEERWLEKHDALAWRTHQMVMDVFADLAAIGKALKNMSHQSTSALPKRRRKTKLLTRKDILNSPDELKPREGSKR